MHFGHADPKLLPERLRSTVGVPVPLCALQSAPTVLRRGIALLLNRGTHHHLT